MRGALEHIAKAARQSRSQTRRLRWIELRADRAVRGEPYEEQAVQLPKSAGPNTPEKLSRKIAHLSSERKELLSALSAAEELIARRWGYPDDASSRASVLADLRAAIAKTTGSAA